MKALTQKQWLGVQPKVPDYQKPLPHVKLRLSPAPPKPSPNGAIHMELFDAARFKAVLLASESGSVLDAPDTLVIAAFRRTRISMDTGFVRREDRNNVKMPHIPVHESIFPWDPRAGKLQ